jgi:hypothetical protein
MNTDITKQMEMVLYRTEDDNVTVSALIKNETLWLTQKAMAELFGIDKSGISRHLAKIFETGELDEEVVVAKIATTTQHGAMQDKTQTNTTNYYMNYSNILNSSILDRRQHGKIKKSG